MNSQLIACKAEAFLKLHQIDDSDSCLSNISNLEKYTPSSQIRYFGMVAEAYALFVQAQVEMALGRWALKDEVTIYDLVLLLGLSENTL